MDDPERTSTYAAEDMVAAWLDAASPETGEVQVTVVRAGRSHLTTFTPEVEPRFSRPSEVAPFVTAVLERLRRQARELGSPYRGREQRDVRVVAGRGWKQATYRDGVVVLPDRERGGAWALRALVVLHELAHHLNTGIDGAFIDEHGAGFRATFVRLLEDVGWVEIASMLREAYHLVGLDREHEADHGMIAKVGKLLRHAEGASTEAEREAFFAKAQELATVHSIELAVARHAHDRDAARQVPTFESVRLGHRREQANVRLIALMVAIARANDLRCSIRGDNTGVTLYGFPDDIAVVKTLYVTLMVQMVADADAYIRSGAHRPVHGRTARAAFYAGWTSRIGERLRQVQRDVRRAAEEDDLDEDGPSAESTSVALALVAKEVEIDDYYGHMMRQHGISGTWRGGSSVDDLHSVVRGRSAADQARLQGRGELSA